MAKLIAVRMKKYILKRHKKKKRRRDTAVVFRKFTTGHSEAQVGPTLRSKGRDGLFRALGRDTLLHILFYEIMSPDLPYPEMNDNTDC